MQVRADGRVLSYSIASGESTSLKGEGHSNFVTALATSSADGKVFSVGFDDRVREITSDGKEFTLVVFSSFIHERSPTVIHRPASLSTASQPKGIAVAEDSSVFVAEVNIVELIRSNQKVFEITPKSAPTAVAATGKLVAVGGEVSLLAVVPPMS